MGPMPWTLHRYPAAMRHLPDPVRRKAIEVANAVLAESGDDGKAIRIGIAQARQWAEHRNAQPGLPGAGWPQGEL